MKFLKVMKDGGSKSHVTGFFFVEIKSLFSIALLRFDHGTREAFHSHAFNAITLWLSGVVREHLYAGGSQLWTPGQLKYTSRGCFHKVETLTKSSWALSVRGPWNPTWKEYLPKENKFVTLTHGRKIVNEVTA
jgi:hypothetical protein